MLHALRAHARCRDREAATPRPPLRAPAARGLESGREPCLWGSVCCLCSSLETPNGKGWAGGAVQWSTCTGPDLGRFLCGQQPLGRQRHPRTAGDPETLSCAPSASNFRLMGPGQSTQRCGHAPCPLQGRACGLSGLASFPSDTARPSPTGPKVGPLNPAGCFYLCIWRCAWLGSL